MNEWVKQTNIRGPQGIQGPRGGSWFTGDDYPGTSMPSPAGRVDGDMYLKNIDPDGGSVWRWDVGALAWIYTGTNITGPPGPQGEPGPAGGGASVAPLPPSNPVPGQLWFNPSTKTLSVWNNGIATWETVVATWE